jgi:hypothetical protein
MSGTPERRRGLIVGHVAGIALRAPVCECGKCRTCYARGRARARKAAKLDRLALIGSGASLSKPKHVKSVVRMACGCGSCNVCTRIVKQAAERQGLLRLRQRDRDRYMASLGNSHREVPPLGYEEEFPGFASELAHAIFWANQNRHRTRPGSTI